MPSVFWFGLWVIESNCQCFISFMKCNISQKKHWLELRGNLCLNFMLNLGQICSLYIALGYSTVRMSTWLQTVVDICICSLGKYLQCGWMLPKQLRGVQWNRCAQEWSKTFEMSQGQDCVVEHDFTPHPVHYRLTLTPNVMLCQTTLPKPPFLSCFTQWPYNNWPVSVQVLVALFESMQRPVSLADLETLVKFSDELRASSTATTSERQTDAQQTVVTALQNKVRAVWEVLEGATYLFM